MMTRVPPTVCVTGAGAGVDSVREQEKPKARKMLENAAESPASSARFVGQPPSGALQKNLLYQVRPSPQEFAV